MLSEFKEEREIIFKTREIESLVVEMIGMDINSLLFDSNIHKWKRVKVSLENE